MAQQKMTNESARPADMAELGSLGDPPGGSWQRIKHNPSRSVYRGRVGESTIYYKQFHPRGILGRLAQLTGLSHARKEAYFSRLLSDAGVPTPQLLAGSWKRGRQWLASLAIEPSQNADSWHLEQLSLGPDGMRSIRRATVALARLVARMHRAGVIHGDLHCGNVLVQPDPQEPKLVLLDLHRVKKRRKLSPFDRAGNLAQLYYDRLNYTSTTDRMRFLKHYLAACGEQTSLRTWIALIERFAHDHTRKQLAQRDRRVFGLNRYFSPIRLKNGWRGHVVLASKRKMAGSRAAELEFTADDWRKLLNRPENLFAPGPNVEIIKDSRSSLVVRRQITVGPNTLDVFVKRARRKHAWKLLIDCFRPSRALRAFELGHALLARRIATVLPLAAMERRVGPILLDSILITEAVNAPQLNRFMEIYLGDNPPAQAQGELVPKRRLTHQVLWQLGKLLQRLHDNQLAHRDLKASNMLVLRRPGALPQIVLIDLDGLRRAVILTARARFQGLMRLNVSLLECPMVNHAGRLKMLLGYLCRPGAAKVNFKPYWRVLQEWSSKKLKRQIRSRRRRQKAARRPTL